MSSPYAISLAPNTLNERSRSFTLDERVWKRAVQLVDKAGYRTNTFAGLSRRDVPVFVQHLRRALDEQGSVSPDDKKVFADLLAFLAGAGAGGFGITRGFKSWRS